MVATNLLLCRYFLAPTIPPSLVTEESSEVILYEQRHVQDSSLSRKDAFFPKVARMGKRKTIRISQTKSGLIVLVKMEVIGEK
jgi:hypothetical protein